MPAPTRQEQIEEAHEAIRACKKARLKVLQAQAYNNSGMALTRARLDEIAKEQKRWEDELAGLEGRGRRHMFNVIPRDY